MKKVKVGGQSKYYDRNIIGKYDSKPILNTTVYDVEFSDGYIREYGSNVIAEKMYSQVDSEGFSHYILSIILDFANDTTALQKDDKYIITKSRQRSMKKSTVGWKLLIS